MKKAAAASVLLCLAMTGLLAGCGDKPVDPTKDSKDQGQQMEIPGRRGRSERSALEAQQKR